MSITYYSFAKKFFAAGTEVIRALESFVDSLTRTLDHVELRYLALIKISLHERDRSMVCNCE